MRAALVSVACLLVLLGLHTTHALSDTTPIMRLRGTTSIGRGGRVLHALPDASSTGAANGGSLNSGTDTASAASAIIAAASTGNGNGNANSNVASSSASTNSNDMASSTGNGIGSIASGSTGTNSMMGSSGSMMMGSSGSMGAGSGSSGNGFDLSLRTLSAQCGTRDAQTRVVVGAQTSTFPPSSMRDAGQEFLRVMADHHASGLAVARFTMVHPNATATLQAEASQLGTTQLNETMMLVRMLSDLYGDAYQPKILADSCAMMDALSSKAGDLLVLWFRAYMFIIEGTGAAVAEQYEPLLKQLQTASVQSATPCYNTAAYMDIAHTNNMRNLLSEIGVGNQTQLNW